MLVGGSDLRLRVFQCDARGRVVRYVRLNFIKNCPPLRQQRFSGRRQLPMQIGKMQ